MGSEVGSLKVWDECKMLASKFYQDMLQAKKQGKVLAWMGGTLPPELIRAMDIVPVFGEPYGAISSSSAERSAEFCAASEARGYSQDICAYARVFIGAMFERRSPWGEFPEPDFVAAGKNPCSTHIKWWEVVSRHLDCPFFVIDTPTAYDRVEKYHIDYFVSQLYRFIEFLEEVTGKQLEEEALCETVYLAKQCMDLWDQVMEFMKAVPCPVDMKTLYTLMLPSIIWRGTWEVVEFNTRLRDELEEWVNKSIGALKEEKCRLMWDNLPIWYDLSLYRFVEQFGAVFVTSVYSQLWGMKSKNLPGRYAPEVEPCSLSRPSNLEEALIDIAKLQIPLAGCLGSLEVITELFIKTAQEFKIDAVILHSNWGCKTQSRGRLVAAQAVREKLGIPTLIIEANSADARNYNGPKVREQIEDFLDLVMEQYEEKAGG
jgi:benzoyl-CoA reductase/2-hydroxyglutaryl-CoA dehydratase subunit BcrC/BadD/HgdB